MVKKKRASASKKVVRHPRKAHHHVDLQAAQDVTEEVIHFLKAAAMSAIVPDMKRFTKEAVHVGQDILYQTQEILLARLYAFAMLGAGGIVLVFGLVYLAETYLAMQRAWSLLAIGLLLIAGSHILQTRIQHRKYYTFK